MSKYMPSFPSGRGNDSLFCGSLRSYSRYSSKVGGNGPRSITQMKYDDTPKITSATTIKITDIRGQRLNSVAAEVLPAKTQDRFVDS